MKKTLGMLVAACMILVLAVPAVGAAEYPQHAQFIAYYDPAALEETSDNANVGIAYVNPDAQISTVSKSLRSTLRTTTISLNDWPQFHYNAAHTGVSPSTGLPSTNGTKWTANVKALGAINPIIENGTIYVITGFAGFDEPSTLNQTNLTALDESTGAVKWNFPLNRTIHYGSWSSPATDGNYVYISSDKKHYAINALTGEGVWNFTGYSMNVNGGPSIGGDYVFFSDWAGNYYNVTKADGTVNWIFNNTDTTRYDMAYAQASPAYDSSDGALYVTGYTYSGANGTGSRGYIYKVDASGREVWSNQSIRGENFCGSASFDSDTVYVTSYNFGDDGSLYAYNKSNGVMRWRQTIERTDATPAIANGMVYVSGGCAGYADPGVRAFYTDGTLAWSRINEGMGGWTDSVSVADGYAFVGHESSNSSSYCYDKTYALNATTGATEWFYQQGGATAAIANGDVYTIGNDGYVYAFG